MTMWRSGLRSFELLALRPGDVRRAPGGALLEVRRGKGGKARTAPLLGDEATEVLGRWMDRRASLGVNGAAPIFCSIERPLPGGPLDTSWLRWMMLRLGRRAGVEGARPHRLRHSFASERARAGRPLAALRDALGHASLATTSSYVAALSPEDLLASLA